MTSFPQEIMGKKELESIPLINIHFGEAVQTHNEEGDESFHIVQQQLWNKQ